MSSQNQDPFLCITFHSSDAQLSDRPAALSLSRKLLAEEHEDTVEVRLSREQTIAQIEQINTLWRLIGELKQSQLSISGKIVAYREFFKYSIIFQCNKDQDQKRSAPGMVCYEQDAKERSWGCLHLRSITRFIPHFQRRDLLKGWYDFGSFDGENRWIVDLDRVYQELKKEATEKNLVHCDRFSLETLKDRVYELPQILDPANDPRWEIVKERSGTEYINKRIRPGYGALDDGDAPLVPVAESSFAATALMNSMDQSRISHIEKDTSYNSSGEDSRKERKERKIPETRFADIGGIDSILSQVREVIELPLVRPNLFKHFGIKPHRGILLFGPPGCGKTMIARAIAREVRAHFIPVNGPEMLSKWHGQSEENLRGIFEEARELSPSIIFFDEIDSIARTRSSDGSGNYDAKMVNQLLTMMDGVEEYEQVAVIAATNRRDVLDPAVLRPGRFDYNLEVPLPDENGIREILQINMRQVPVSSKIEIDSLVQALHGKTGADISFIVREAAYNSIRRNINISEALRGKDQESYSYTVEQKDFDLALEKLLHQN